VLFIEYFAKITSNFTADPNFPWWTK